VLGVGGLGEGVWVGKPYPLHKAASRRKSSRKSNERVTRDRVFGFGERLKLEVSASNGRKKRVGGCAQYSPKGRSTRYSESRDRAGKEKGKTS